MLRGIRGAILKDARAEGEGALQKAEAELEAELARVRSEGEARVAAAEDEARKIVEAERRERLSWAKLEAKRVLADAREDAANEALESIIERMKLYTGSPAYAKLMKAKIADAVKEVGGRAVVHVRRVDRKLLEVPGADMAGDADIIGGAIVESKDGRLRIDLSMEAFLEAKRDFLRKAIYAALFSLEGGAKPKGRK